MGIFLVNLKNRNSRNIPARVAHTHGQHTTDNCRPPFLEYSGIFLEYSWATQLARFFQQEWVQPPASVCCMAECQSPDCTRPATHFTLTTPPWYLCDDHVGSWEVAPIDVDGGVLTVGSTIYDHVTPATPCYHCGGFASTTLYGGTAELCISCVVALLCRVSDETKQSARQ
jgi:hypothetical protein